VCSKGTFITCISHDEIQEPFQRPSPCALRKGQDHSVPEVPLVECTAATSLNRRNGIALDLSAVDDPAQPTTEDCSENPPTASRPARTMHCSLHGMLSCGLMA
jgi:hypothetical protein